MSKAEQQVASETRSGSLYSREGGPTGSRGRQGTSGAAEARKVPGGQWIITRWGQDEFFSSPTDQLLPPLYIPNHSPPASEQLAEVRAYNGQQVTRRTMCRKCRKNARLVHNGRNTQEYDGWGVACPHCSLLVVLVLLQIPRLSVFTNFQLPFNCRLSDHPV